MTKAFDENNFWNPKIHVTSWWLFCSCHDEKGENFDAYSEFMETSLKLLATKLHSHYTQIYTELDKDHHFASYSNIYS
jgi:hypothetical protein